MHYRVYEYITGGGTWSNDDIFPQGSLLREGHAMVSALVQDLRRLPNSDVIVLRDSRLGSLAIPAHRIYSVDSEEAELLALLEIGSRVDAVILIAPETQGILQ